MLSVNGLNKKYPGLKVLQNINADFQPGSFHAIVGGNGAGKSTLLNIMGRLLDADSGQVTLDGEPISEIPERRLAREIAILKQSLEIHANLTVFDLAAMGRFPHCRGILQDRDREKIEEALRITELTELADKPVMHLSGGQRQRAFIAMIIAQDTRYILMDEPLNNLDMRHGRQLMALLARLSREYGKTVIMVLHDINIAAAFSDHIHAICDTQLYFSGETQEFIRTDHLSRVFGVEFDIIEHRGRKVCLPRGEDIDAPPVIRANILSSTA